MSKGQSNLRIAFAGDRDIGVAVLRRILADEVKPLALLVSDPAKASHADELTRMCSFLPPERILVGSQFRQPSGIELLRGLDLDYVIGVHFPYVVPPEVLSLPRQGVLNLHPAFLPYNRGWHTPSWAILEDTPIGATLHFMDEGVDTGDIVHQKRIEISPGHTANSLYGELKELELTVFEEAWPRLLAGDYKRQRQDPSAGSEHKRKDLFQPDIQQIDLDATVKASDLLRTLRALTTNQVNEAAYFEAKGNRYRVQLFLHEE